MPSLCAEAEDRCFLVGCPDGSQLEEAIWTLDLASSGGRQSSHASELCSGVSSGKISLLFVCKGTGLPSFLTVEGCCCNGEEQLMCGGARLVGVVGSNGGGVEELDGAAGSMTKACVRQIYLANKVVVFLSQVVIENIGDNYVAPVDNRSKSSKTKLDLDFVKLLNHTWWNNGRIVEFLVVNRVVCRRFKEMLDSFTNHHEVCHIILIDDNAIESKTEGKRVIKTNRMIEMKESKTKLK